MNLLKKKLQELKEKKTSIEELNDKYFICSSYIEIENMFQLLNNNICSFQQVVNKYKSIKNEEDAPCLYELLENQRLFEKLFENNHLNQTDLRYLLNTIDKWYEVDKLNENTSLLKYIIDNALFKELVDKHKSIENGDDEQPGLYNEPCLYKLLDNKELFKKLIQNNLLNTEDTRYLLNRIDEIYELHRLCENTSLLMYIVDSGVSFKELVDTFKGIKDKDNKPCLYLLLAKELLENKELFKELIQNNLLNTEDLRYLLNKIDNTDELLQLCNNTSLIKFVLNEFILSNVIVDKFYTIIENDDEYDWCKDRNIHTLFEFIEYENENNEEVLKLNELNKRVYLLNSFDLTENQKLELIEVLKNNEQAQGLLKQIVDNHLEDTYDFDTLKKILTKDEEKKKIKMNI